MVPSSSGPDWFGPARAALGFFSLFFPAIAAETPGEDGLLDMQPVLGLLPHRRLRAVDHLRRHLVAAMGRQAMHEDRVLRRFFHHSAVDLTRTQRFRPLPRIVVAPRT